MLHVALSKATLKGVACNVLSVKLISSKYSIVIYYIGAMPVDRHFLKKVTLWIKASSTYDWEPGCDSIF